VGETGLHRHGPAPRLQRHAQDAEAFCRWLSKKETKTYRLPTEAEWEYACRAGTTTPWSTGETAAKETWRCGRSPTPRTRCTPFAQFPANPFGLYDMHGNAAELCADFFDPDFYTAALAENRPAPPTAAKATPSAAAASTNPPATPARPTGATAPVRHRCRSLPRGVRGRPVTWDLRRGAQAS
jgi:formylglycine-generating enzyme required for sulfatase activity